jgi:hypothetical protein
MLLPQMRISFGQAFPAGHGEYRYIPHATSEMTPYLARLLDISINNGTIPGDSEKIHRGSCLQRR